MAPAIMGNPDRPELGQELTNSFCRTDPEMRRPSRASPSRRTTGLTLPGATVPTLILQCSDDIIASEEVGNYVHRHITGQQIGSHEGERTLPEPECAGGNHFCNPRFCLMQAGSTASEPDPPEEDLRDLR